MDITYIEELVEELEDSMNKALSKITSKSTVDMNDYQYWKGRYHTLRELCNTLKQRHAID